MPQHESKVCQRCLRNFGCKVDDVVNCECSSIALTDEARMFIRNHYTDCLCINCLKELKNKNVLFKKEILES